MGLFGGSAPDAPDVQPYANQMWADSDNYAAISKEQLEFARGVWKEQLARAQTVSDFQQAGAMDALGWARQDRQFFEETFNPLNKRIVNDAMTWDSPERMEREAGRSAADVASAMEAQREATLSDLNGYGVDVSNLRGTAMDANARLMGTMASTGAANQARTRVEEQGVGMRQQASALGGQYIDSWGRNMNLAGNLGNSSIGNYNNTFATQMNAAGTPGQWAGQSAQSRRDAANTVNAGYQNEMAAYNAGGGALGGFGSLMGMAIGGASSYAGARYGGQEEGGLVPDDTAPTPGPNDKYPTMLAENEFVIPADVVLRMGTDKLEALIEKSREPKALPESGGTQNA